MNTMVFQEMREARGLAYSAWARFSSPSYADGTYSYLAFIATQNDKMKTAIEAFADIKDLDTDYLSTLGPVKTVTLEEIFGH